MTAVKQCDTLIFRIIKEMDVSKGLQIKVPSFQALIVSLLIVGCERHKKRDGKNIDAFEHAGEDCWKHPGKNQIKHKLAQHPGMITAWPAESKHHLTRNCLAVWNKREKAAHDTTF